MSGLWVHGLEVQGFWCRFLKLRVWRFRVSSRRRLQDLIIFLCLNMISGLQVLGIPGSQVYFLIRPLGLKD